MTWFLPPQKAWKRGTGRYQDGAAMLTGPSQQCGMTTKAGESTR